MLNFIKKVSSNTLCFIFFGLALVLTVTAKIGYIANTGAIGSAYSVLPFAFMYFFLCLYLAKDNKVAVLGFLTALIGFRMLSAFPGFTGSLTQAFGTDWSASGAHAHYGAIQLFYGIGYLGLFVFGLFYVLGKFVLKNKKLCVLISVIGMLVNIAAILVSVILMIAYIARDAAGAPGLVWYDVFGEIAGLCECIGLIFAAAVAESVNKADAK